VPVDEIESGTYELIGPKIQNNHYGLPSEPKVPVNLVRKGELRTALVEPHVFVRHGAFPVSLPPTFDLTLDNLRDFIVTNEIEGLVFYFTWPGGGVHFKVNRGHIGIELANDARLQLALPERQ